MSPPQQPAPVEGEERCNVLMALFQTIINDMKESAPAFEDLAAKTTKLHASLRTTITSTALFLEAFQKVADVATNSRGATKEIGKALTRLCLRQRTIENKFKAFTSTLLDRLVTPLQETVADWQKAVVQLDKDHAREHKKARADIKRAASDTVRLQRKAKKGKSDAKEKLESAMRGVNEMYVALEESEKKHVRLALIHERKQFCHFITCVDPIVAAEISMLNEATHLQEILDSLCSLAADPDNLPEVSEHVIADVTRADIKSTDAFHQSPPGTPNSVVRSSRRSSLSSVSSLASASEADSAIGISPNHHGGSGQKISHGSDGDLLGDHSSLSSKHSSYYSGGGRGSSGAATGNAGDDVFDSVSLQVPPHLASSAGAHPQSRATVDRPHTISTAAASGFGILAEVAATRQLPQLHHAARPPLHADTFVPPTHARPLSVAASASGGNAIELASANSHSRTPSPVMPAPSAPAALVMPPPPKPLPGLMRRDTVHGGTSGRNLPPRVMRAKPVALPSVPFMATEPVYMNTQELAARIAEKRLSAEQQLPNPPQHDAAAQLPANFRPVSEPPDQRDQQQLAQSAAAASLAAAAVAARTRSSASSVTSEQRASNPDTALANAIKELEASTAALNDTCDGFLPPPPPLSPPLPVSPLPPPPPMSPQLLSQPASPLPPPPTSPFPPPPLDTAETAGVKVANGDLTVTGPALPVPSASKAFDPPSVATAEVTAATATSSIDHDQLRIAQGRPVQTWAGPAVLRRSASVKPPPPMRKSSSVSSPKSLEAELAIKSTSPPVGSAASFANLTTNGSASLLPGGASVPTGPPQAAASLSVAPVASVPSSTQGTSQRDIAVAAAIANAAVARIEDRASAVSATQPTAASAKTQLPAVAAKAPPPTVAAKPTVKRDSLAPSSSSSSARPVDGPVASSAPVGGGSGIAPATATSQSSSSPAPWERPASVVTLPPASLVSLPPWERAAAAASVVAASEQQRHHQDSGSATAAVGRLNPDFRASLSAKLTAGTPWPASAVSSSAPLSGNGAVDAAAAGTEGATSHSAAAAASVKNWELSAQNHSSMGNAIRSVGAVGMTTTAPLSHIAEVASESAATSGNLMSQIQSGVALKRAQTNDRSAPRMT